jgi:hypothetical protein
VGWTLTCLGGNGNWEWERDGVGGWMGGWSAFDMAFLFPLFLVRFETSKRIILYLASIHTYMRCGCGCRGVYLGIGK